MEGGQGGGGRQEHGGQCQADEGEMQERILQRAGGFAAQGRVLLGEEGADAHHLGLERLEQAEVLGQGFFALSR